MPPTNPSSAATSHIDCHHVQAANPLPDVILKAQPTIEQSHPYSPSLPVTILNSAVCIVVLLFFGGSTLFATYFKDLPAAKLFLELLCGLISIGSIVEDFFSLWLVKKSRWVASTVFAIAYYATFLLISRPVGTYEVVSTIANCSTILGLLINFVNQLQSAIFAYKARKNSK